MIIFFINVVSPLIIIIIYLAQIKSHQGVTGYTRNDITRTRLSYYPARDANFHQGHDEKNRHNNYLFWLVTFSYYVFFLISRGKLVDTFPNGRIKNKILVVHNKIRKLILII